MNKILNFQNRSQPFEIRAKSATKAEIVIYDQIGRGWFSEGVTAKSFSEELKKLDGAVNEITVRINSPGGDVFEGIAIYNRLVQHKAKIIVHIDGLAASIASIIALAGDEINIGEGALYMIHLPWTMAMGNRMEMENTTQRLVDIEEQMISMYAKKTKLDRGEIRVMLEKETWMDADQAIEMGFVDAKSEDTIAIAASVMEKEWIRKAPKNFVSEASVLREKSLELKNKIDARLARK